MKPTKDETSRLEEAGDDAANALPSSLPAALHPRWMLVCGNFFFRVRNGLFPVLFVLILVFLRPARFPGGPQVDQAITALGLLAVLAGQFVRFFVIGYAYIRRGGKKRRIHADRLVVAGLYAHSRNPMYLGNLLIAYGFSFYFGSLWLCVFTLPFFTWVYLAITAAEEQFLLEKFGAPYAAYLRSVSRFVPHLRGLPRSLAKHPFRWREAVSKEHGTLFATLMGLTVVSFWKHICISGWEAGLAQARHLPWLMILWALLYAVARFMKTTGRLQGGSARSAKTRRDEAPAESFAPANEI